jgi:hypothetical protein
MDLACMKRMNWYIIPNKKSFTMPLVEMRGYWISNTKYLAIKKKNLYTRELIYYIPGHVFATVSVLCMGENILLQGKTDVVFVWD